VMLQVTSARHVLRRDPDGAEEALRAAEDVGRRSMRELRRTVALLRSDGDEASAPLPSAREIPALVDEARAGGLAIELRVRGDLSRMGPSVDAAVYRIAQEALANAARHAPQATTIVALHVDSDRVRLDADTLGAPAPQPDAGGDRPRYGVIGMRERAATLGGELTAAPTPRGWCLRCTLPLDAGEAPAAGEDGT
ncbi:MAG TPA: histidine kinase, partial [Capillimicrobium sp.]